MPIQRGDIDFVNLNPVQGREQAGQRPVLIVSIDTINRLPLVVTVVVGTKGDNVSRDYPTNVRLSAIPAAGPIASDVRFKKRVVGSLAIHFALIPVFPQSEKARCLLEKDTKS